MESRRWLVTGRVQGVGFRAFVMRRARELQLDGWVRNRPEGSVEIVATGPVDALSSLAEAVASGPSYARGDRVDVAGIQNHATAGRGVDLRFDA